MGMYDSIKIEYPLDNLPQNLIDSWQGDITFQTKDTPDQYMSLYKIDEGGKLWHQERETEWVKSETPDAELFADRIGHMNIISKTWKQIDFHGAINFYDSYNHEEYKYEFNSGESKEWQRYELGWIEYCALFKDGQMISINLVKDEKPVKLTDEQLEEKRIKWVKQREEIQENCRRNRKNSPTAEQKLIDSIYESTQEPVVIIKIDEYRKKYDKFYTND
jgi:hypothetical protein